MKNSGRVISGIQSSGTLTIGNYIGAIKNFLLLQNTHECYIFIADLHAVTVPQNPAALREQSEAVAALYIAAGLDPEKTMIFMQSHIPQHAELAWLLTTLTSMGELERMTQFKDKTSAQETIGTGLFTYPILMAADILLYNADLVPVGSDQKQHLELTRNLAERFNQRYKETFLIPQPYIPEHGARIMSLENAFKKMSKSSANQASYISLLDPPETIRKKISRAKTDMEREIRFDPQNKPEVSNLMTIFSEVGQLTISQIEKQYSGQGYGTFKKDLAEIVIERLLPLQTRYHEILRSGEVQRILGAGAQQAEAIAAKTLTKVKAAMGFLAKS